MTSSGTCTITFESWLAWRPDGNDRPVSNWRCCRIVVKSQTALLRILQRAVYRSPRGARSSGMMFTQNPADERRLAAPSGGGDRHWGFRDAGSRPSAHSSRRACDGSYEDVGWLRPVANVDKMHSGVSLTDEDRRPWLKAVAAWIDQGRRLGRHGAVACTALKRRYRDVLDRQSC